MQISTLDPASIRKENSIYEKVHFEFTREEVSSDIHEIKLSNSNPDSFTFNLRIGDHVTEPISLKEDKKMIIKKLESLSAKVVKSF